MFSTNQKLEISGNIEDNAIDLQNALTFAFTASGNIDRFESGEMDCVYRQLNDGRVVLGWMGSPEASLPAPSELPEWSRFPFKFDIDLIAQIIRNWLNSIAVDDDEEIDGTHERGFVLKRADFAWDPDMCEYVREPWREIVVIEPYECFYAK